MYADVLQMFRPHLIPTVLKDFNFGVQVRFDYMLNKWQQSQDINHKTPIIVEKKTQDLKINNTQNSVITNDAIKFLPTISVNNILKESKQGELIIEFYNKYKMLNDINRQILVDVIVNHFIKQDIVLTTTLSESIAKQIKLIFPAEIEEYYFLKRTGAAPKGKLYTKFHNNKTRLRKAGLLNQDILNKSQKLNIESSNENNSENTKTIEPHLHALKYGNLRFTEILEHWKLTSDNRITFIKNSENIDVVLKAWPQYKLPSGYKLVNIN